MDPFTRPSEVACQKKSTKGAPARKSLNGSIIFSVAALSKGPFHTYHHLLLAFLQFFGVTVDGLHCFPKS